MQTDVTCCGPSAEHEVFFLPCKVSDQFEAGVHVFAGSGSGCHLDGQIEIQIQIQIQINIQSPNQLLSCLWLLLPMFMGYFLAHIPFPIWIRSSQRWLPWSNICRRRHFTGTAGLPPGGASFSPGLAKRLLVLGTPLCIFFRPFLFASARG